jgi:HAD superfamily hydrolase (TIGR01549 family)
MRKIKMAVGAGLGKFLEDIFKKVIKKYGLDKIRKDYVKLYRKYFTYKIRTFPGVLQVLKDLKKRKIKMVILSNKLFYFIKKSCQYVGIYKFFNEIIGRGDLIKDKPDPYPINYISQKYKINKKNILLVGDSQYDAECAARAKIDFFYLNYGYGNKNKTKKFKPTYSKVKIFDLLKVIN